MAEKALPISAAEVSIPGFAIRFNDIALRLSDRTVARQLIPRAHYICGIAHTIRVFSVHWRLNALFLAAWRWARPAAMIQAALTISTTFLFELPAVKCRQTNVDLIAAQLSSELAPNDYVIVHPFFCGVTFNRYYKGAAPWTTLPPLDDYTLQRYDLFQAKMQTKDPIAPVIDRITSTLQSGNRVWLVGTIPFTEQPLPEIRPAPNNQVDGPYSFYWGVQVTQFLSAHSQRSAVAIAPSTNCVNPPESLPVFVVAGWKP